MLKTLPDFMTADLLWVLAAMGHGDVLALVDRNFPAQSVARSTTSGRCIELPGLDVAAAAQGLLQLLPVDDFDATPLVWMDPVDAPGVQLPVHRDVIACVNAAEGRAVTGAALARAAFYAAARRAFAVVQTSEARPYGCFLLTKGVVRA